MVGSGSVAGGEVSVDVSKSSQFVSGLLLSAARFDEGLTLRNTGRVAPNRPHIDLTLRMLAAHQVNAAPVPDGGTETWRVEPSEVTARDWTVEPDLSNATPVHRCRPARQEGPSGSTGWVAAASRPSARWRHWSRRWGAPST